MEGTPGFAVPDDTFDEIVDAVDGRVVSFIDFGEFAVIGFPGEGDHSQSDVRFVSNMTLTIEGCEESGFLDGLRIMHTAC